MCKRPINSLHHTNKEPHSNTQKKKTTKMVKKKDVHSFSNTKYQESEVNQDNSQVKFISVEHLKQPQLTKVLHR